MILSRRFSPRWQAMRGILHAIVSLSILCCFVSAATAVDEPDTATWRPVPAAAARNVVFDSLRSAKVTSDVLQQAEQSWPIESELQGVELLLHTVQVLALSDRDAALLRDACESGAIDKLPAIDWLKDEARPAVLRHNVRLYLGRRLSLARRYDESLVQLAGLRPADVVDPASLLFYQSVAQHWALERETGLTTIAQLLEREAELPRRYGSLAKLMQADLISLKEDSLDHISRRMNDVRRRLEIGDGPDKTIEVEKGVIASLDKLIKDLEDQQQQQDSSGGGGSAGGKPTQPANDSTPIGGKGPGEVARKNIGVAGGWGDLPPKQRQEALQGLTKDFPSHYREVIESYFRRLARDPQEDRQ